jgi:hypothetical protein
MSIEICGPGCKRRPVGRLYFQNGGVHCAFDYTRHLECLLRGWCRLYPQLGHIEMDRVVLAVARCRSKTTQGPCASITSLACGEKLEPAAGEGCGGQLYGWPKVRKEGREALYLVKFYLPRFHNLSLDDKVSTILHELHHIHPKFNGQFRSFGGRNWAHGNSHGELERMFECLKRDILKRIDPFCNVFLNCRFHALLKRFGDVYGDHVVLSPAEVAPAVLYGTRWDTPRADA